MVLDCTLKYCICYGNHENVSSQKTQKFLLIEQEITVILLLEMLESESH